MKDYVRQNKSAWEFNAYEFWVEHDGTPEERARRDLEDPVGMLKKYAAEVGKEFLPDVYPLIPMKESGLPISAAPAVKRPFRWRFSARR